MVKVIADEALRNKLHQFTEPVEICDEAGQVLAKVTPVDVLAQFIPWVPEFDEEELQRREKSDHWHTTEEVLAHLKRLENS